MNTTSRYAEGQRWEFKTNIREFENTLVIGHVIEAQPRGGWNDATYDVYVKYSSLAEKAIPANYDGEMLSLTAAALDRSVMRLVETEVNLPWWWKYGRRLAKEDDAIGRTIVSYPCDNVQNLLPMFFEMACQRAEAVRQSVEAIQRHFLEFESASPPRSPSKSVRESWDRIAAWIAEHAPGYTFPLNQGATEAAIRTFEEAIGKKLPDDFRESVRLHDGGDCWMLPSHGGLLSLDRILEQWEMYRSWWQTGDYATEEWIPRETAGPIKPVFWNDKRIPISDNSGNHLTLDLDPPDSGVYGQILDHDHEVGPTAVLSPSWGLFLRQLVDDLETGKYVYYEFDCCLEPLEWRDRRLNT